MKFIGNKTALKFVIVNIILVVVGYFGLLDSAGFLNSITPSADLITGTAAEYWKYKIDFYYSIIFIAFFVMNFVAILFYRGKGNFLSKLSSALIIQLLILTVVNIISVYLIKGYKTADLSNFEISQFGVYQLIVAVTSAMIIYKFDVKKYLTIAATACACLGVTFIYNLENNIFRTDLANRYTVVDNKLKPIGQPIMKYEITLLGGRSYQDGVSTIESVTDNYSNHLDLLNYASINKPSNEEVFNIVERFYEKRVNHDETYLKNKMGDKFYQTKLQINNKLSKGYKENDMKLIKTYKTQGLEAAMKEMNEMKNGSTIRLLINTTSPDKQKVDSAKTFDERPKM